MEHGSRSVLGRAGDNLVLELVTGGNQGGQRKSVDEEAKEKQAAVGNWKVGSRFVPTCAVNRKGRRLNDYSAQKLTEEQRTVWDSRRWNLEQWERAVSRATNESACHMHALQ